MRALFLLPLFLSFCTPDETISGYLDRAANWTLVELDGDASDALLRLRFPAEGEVTGTDACGTFTARQTAPYPWFELRELDDAPAGCGAGLRRTLGTMGFAEVSGDLLLLSADDGREMLLRAD